MSTTGAGRNYDYESKRDWAREKMDDAVRDGNLEDAQKFRDIGNAYDRRAWLKNH